MESARYRRLRRAALRSLAGLGALPWTGVLGAGAIAAAPSFGACMLTPAMTEGPFFVDERLNRSDLVADSTDPAVRNGYPLDLAVRVVSVRAQCEPLAGIQVDVWHTDALGRYSDVEDQRGKTFCRGYQLTDPQGYARFRTIYPGWYPGRTIHVHVKMRRSDRRGGSRAEFTTQIFFEERVNDAVMAMPPYDSRGPRTTRNAGDGLYRSATGLLATTQPRAGGAPGLAASFTVALDFPATG